MKQKPKRAEEARVQKLSERKREKKIVGAETSGEIPGLSTTRRKPRTDHSLEEEAEEENKANTTTTRWLLLVE